MPGNKRVHKKIKKRKVIRGSKYSFSEVLLVRYAA